MTTINHPPEEAMLRDIEKLREEAYDWRLKFEEAERLRNATWQMLYAAVRHYGVATGDARVLSTIQVPPAVPSEGQELVSAAMADGTIIVQIVQLPPPEVSLGTAEDVPPSTPDLPEPEDPPLERPAEAHFAANESEGVPPLSDAEKAMMEVSD